MVAGRRGVKGNFLFPLERCSRCRTSWGSGNCRCASAAIQKLRLLQPCMAILNWRPAPPRLLSKPPDSSH